MIYFIANANVVSGGPELLHQCCSKLSNLGFESSILYFSKFSFGVAPSSQVIERYGRYNCNVVKKIEDTPDNTVIFGEGQWFFLPKFKHVKKVFWWLSVDNYYSSFSLSYAKFYAPFGSNGEKYNPFVDGITHCCQSEYARLFLKEKGVSENNIVDLFDYLSDEFLQKTKNEKLRRKEDVILYNPKKGFEFTSKLIEANDELKWYALENLTRDKMIDLMTTAKVYVDFGNHPGKDRIPREAAMCGCIVITGKRGSANNSVDVPIPDEYKISDEVENIPHIIDTIKKSIVEYDVRRCEFDEYREIIMHEEEEFDNQVKSLGDMLVGSK